MKILITFLMGILLCQGVIGSPFPEPGFGDMAKGIANGITGASTKAGSIVAGIAKGWGKLVAGAVNTAGSIAHGAINASVNMVSGVANGWASMVSRTAQRFANMTAAIEDAFLGVLNIGGNSFKKVSEEIKNRIQEIKMKVDDAMSEMEEKLKEGLDKVNETLKDHKANIESWIDEIKNKYNYKDLPEADLEKVDQLVQDFVTKSSEDLSQCAEKITAPIKDMFTEAQDAINAVLPSAENVITEMGKCFKSHRFNPIKLTQCAWEARTNLPTLSDITDLMTNLQNALDKFKLDDLSNFSCMKDTLEKIKERKDELDSEIGKIAEKQKVGGSDGNKESGSETGGDKQVEGGDKQVEGGDKQVEGGDKEVEGGDKQVEGGDKEVEGGDQQVEN